MRAGHDRRRAGGSIAAALLLSGTAGLVWAAPSSAAATARDAAAALTVPSGATPLGALAGSQPLEGEVALASPDPAGLEGFVAGVTTPGSPTYRQFLAPGAFGARFGASPATLEAVRSWLEGAGLQVTGTDPDGLFVGFSGPASAVASSLGVSLGRYRFHGVTGYGATGTPLVPTSLVGQVRAVVGLSDLVRPVDHVVTQPASVPSSASPPAGAPPAAGPHVTTSGPTACVQAQEAHSWTADQVAGAYGVSPLYGQGRLGSGVTVALYELEPFSATDVATYQSCYGTHATVSVVAVNGGLSTGTGSDPEAALDVETVIGMAPQAAIEAYEGPSANQAQILSIYQRIADDDSAQVVSTSWGLCEPYLGSSWAAAQSPVFEQMAAQGQALFAAAGDSGSEDCYPYDATANRLAVDDPADQPDAIGVGGTSLTSVAPRREATWNNCEGAGSSTCAYDQTFTSSATGGAGGGGISGFFAMPTWQQAVVGPSSGAREVPDVAASADPYFGDPVYWSGSGSPGWIVVGGTSAAVVYWAGVAAVVDQGCVHGGAGVVTAAALYGAGAGAFNDVTAGDNDYTNAFGLYGAGPGYDMATGVGSPDAAALLGAIEPGGLCPSSSSGLPTVAVQGPGGRLWVYWKTPSSQWVGPLGVGAPGSTLSAPAVAVAPSGLATVAVQGPGDSLWLYWQAPNATWVGPLGVGAPGSTLSAPAISVGPSGLPIVAVQGPGGRLWLYWETAGAQWLGPLGVGDAGSTNAPPAVSTSPATGLSTVAVEGPGGRVWLYWQAPNATWVGPYGVGGAGSTSTAPAVATAPSGLSTVAVQGPGGRLWLYWQAPNASWIGPLGVGGPGSTSTAPAIADSPASGLPTVAVQGPGASLWVYWETAGAQWVGPLGVGAPGSTISAPAIGAGLSGLPSVAVQSPGAGLDLYWQTPDASWVGPLGVGVAGSTQAPPSLGAAP